MTSIRDDFEKDVHGLADLLPESRSSDSSLLPKSLPVSDVPLAQRNLKSFIDTFVQYSKLVDVVPIINDTQIELDEPDPTYIHVLVKGVTALTLTLVDDIWVVDPVADACAQLDRLGMNYELWARMFFDFWRHEYARYGLTTKIHNDSYSGEMAGETEEFCFVQTMAVGGSYLSFRRGKHRRAEPAPLLPVWPHISPDALPVVDTSAVREIVLGGFTSHYYGNRFYDKDAIKKAVDEHRSIRDVGASPLLYHNVGRRLSVDPGQLRVDLVGGNNFWRDSQHLHRLGREKTTREFTVLEPTLRRQAQSVVCKPKPKLPRGYSKSIIGITVTFNKHPGYVLTLCEHRNPVYILGIPDCETRPGKNLSLYAAGAYVQVSKMLGKPYFRF